MSTVHLPFERQDAQSGCRLDEGLCDGLQGSRAKIACIPYLTVRAAYLHDLPNAADDDGLQGVVLNWLSWALRHHNGALRLTAKRARKGSASQCSVIVPKLLRINRAKLDPVLREQALGNFEHSHTQMNQSHQADSGHFRGILPAKEHLEGLDGGAQ